MYRTMMKSKLHRAVVTESNLNYVGSITIDSDLIQAIDLLENEQVTVVNINNGARFETYVIPGKAGSGEICLNGAGARLVQPGDKVIIISYGIYSEEEVKKYQAKIALLNDENKIIKFLSQEDNHK